MNGNFFKNPTFPTLNEEEIQEMYPYESGYEAGGTDALNMQQSYIENILRHNKGKVVKVYSSYPDSEDCRDKVFEGVIEQAGRDHIVLRDTKNGKWYLILMIYLNYVEFEEAIDYTEVSPYAK